MVVGLATCYYFFYGRDFVFRFSEPQLQQALADRLPIRKSYYLIFVVTLDNPRVHLVEGSDRVNAGLDVAFNIRLNNNPLPLSGSVDASGAVRYEPATGQFFLTDPKVEQLSVKGIPAKYEKPVATILSLLLDEYYRTRPIYTLKQANFKQAVARLVLQSVEVKAQELVVTLGVGS